MIRKLSALIFIAGLLSTTGCIKETYDMGKLSGKIHLSPTLAISAIKGGISLSDIVKSSDAVVFDQNKFVKVVFKKDSVLNIKMSDFYDLTSMVAFSQSYTMGDLSIDPFSAIMPFTLSQIIAGFSPALKAQFTALDNGATHPFPIFPSVNLGEKTFTGITNFETAIFRSGFLDISIKNNLTAPLSSINVSLFNTTGHAAIGSSVTIPAVQPGQTSTGTIDLTNKTVTNSIIIATVLSGSPGNTTPVLIKLNTSNVQITISGRALKVKSGRVKLPQQTVLSVDNKDTINFNLGTGVELDKLKTTTGNLSYHIVSSSDLSASLSISMPTALRAGIPVSKVISISPRVTLDGTIPFDNTIVDMATIVQKPFNQIPFAYSIDVNSNSTIVNFNSTDKFQFDLKLLNPVFDYIKGYFGQKVETITPDSLNLGIDDILRHITGDFLISSPSIKVNYSNSFAIPLQIAFTATGKRKTKPNVNLGLAPFNITPSTFANRDVSATFAVDKNNSSLPALLSMPPEEIRFSGSATMNPSGNNGLRDNYIFGSSRILGALEIEVPLEFKLNNLQFTDTLDNFMKTSGGSSNSPVKPENFKLLRVDLVAKNGFPLGVSLKMSLYDSLTDTIKSTIDATGLLKPAPIDVNGKVTGITETTTSLEFTEQFFSSISKADKIIFQFTLNTTDSGTKDVKIYSDYRIDFNAALVAKPDITLK